MRMLSHSFEEDTCFMKIYTRFNAAYIVYNHRVSE